MQTNARIGAIGLALIALLPWMADAQEYMPEVKPGQTVWAVTTDGVSTRGKVLSVSDSSLELLHNDQQTSLPIRRIQRVETRDSLKNGAIIGAIPAAAGVGFLAGFAAAFSNCPLFSNPGCETHAGAATALGAVTGAGAGALIGAGIDRLIPGRRIVYGSKSVPIKITLLPAAGSAHLGTRLSVTW